MAHLNGATEFEPAQGKRERHGGERNQHQHPEGVHVAEERADPLNDLILRLRQRAAWVVK